VCDQEISKNEEVKTRNRAVKNRTRWVGTPRKQTNKQTLGVRDRASLINVSSETNRCNNVMNIFLS
jgi:hypothetical protein